MREIIEMAVKLLFGTFAQFFRHERYFARVVFPIEGRERKTYNLRAVHCNVGR
jgi:hypothetical protein